MSDDYEREFPCAHLYKIEPVESLEGKFDVTFRFSSRNSYAIRPFIERLSRLWDRWIPEKEFDDLIRKMEECRTKEDLIDNDC